MNKLRPGLFHEVHGEGPPLVMLHGLFLDHHLWDPLTPLLEDRARIVLPDLRGHGRSFSPDGPYRISDMAYDVTRLLDELGIKKAILAGHSMGGYVCLAACHLFPERISGLALVASHAAPDSPERKQGRYDTARNLPDTGLEPMVRDMATLLTDEPRFQRVLLNTMLSTGITGAVGSLYAIAEREDALPWLVQTRYPILLVHGARDRFIPQERMLDILSARPDAHPVEIAGAGHVPMMEAPRLVAEALRWLIDQVSWSPPG